MKNKKGDKNNFNQENSKKNDDAPKQEKERWWL